MSDKYDPSVDLTKSLVRAPIGSKNDPATVAMVVKLVQRQFAILVDDKRQNAHKKDDEHTTAIVAV